MPEGDIISLQEELGYQAFYDYIEISRNHFILKRYIDIELLVSAIILWKMIFILT